MIQEYARVSVEMPENEDKNYGKEKRYLPDCR